MAVSVTVLHVALLVSATCSSSISITVLHTFVAFIMTVLRADMTVNVTILHADLTVSVIIYHASLGSRLQY